MATTTDILRNYLQDKKPLSVVTFQELYDVFPDIPHGRIISTMHRLCLGTVVSGKNRRSTYYAIQMTLATGKVFLSLPGISAEHLEYDILNEARVEGIINTLKKHYGEQTIRYWAKSAQYRSVTLSKGMGTARQRDDGICVLCKVEGEVSKRASACHMISRKSVFWKALDEVHQSIGNIFSDESVILLKEKIRANDAHSSHKFIVYLCTAHDKQLLNTIRQAVMSGKAGRDFASPMPLFQGAAMN